MFGKQKKNSVVVFFIFSQGANNYTFDEIQVALTNCSNGDPLTWLNENWTKLIETVQTLATKYGQEHKENIVGTISSAEARDVLIKNKGSVWHAVTQCIEQRQQAFNTIKSQGNYSREDIVSTLTAHNGNVEMAMAELNRLQMKPFLLKIQAGTENEPSIQNDQPSTSRQAENQTHENNVLSKENDSQANEDKRDILRDIEAIIGSMEEKQSKQTETLLSTIENLVGNMILSNTSRSMSSASSFSGLDHSDHLDRIHVKSPIVIPSKAGNEFDQNTDVETDVKNFVTRHIQDVVPDVAALISKELVERPEQNFGENENEGVPLEEEVPVGITTQEFAASITVNGEPETIETAVTSKIEATAINEPSNVNATAVTTNKPTTSINERNISNGVQTSSKTPAIVATRNENAENIEVVKGKPAPLQNGEAHTLEMPSTSKVELVQQSRVNKPRYVVTKSSARFTQKQIDKRRIRELEKQLKRQQRAQRSHSINTDRSESQSTGYLSDATVVAEDMHDEEEMITIPAVSNEKTFSLSIIEQAALVDDNKEHNQTISSPFTRSPDLLNPPSSSNNWPQPDEPIQKFASTENDVIETVKEVKNRNLSELVEHTKNLIQQMKNEIDEDIAMSASEFDEGENDGYLSDEIIYSDEMGEGESEFSDSWEDISDEESIISEEGEYSEDERNAEFQRSSQSVESEFYVEARESLNSVNESIFEENEENVALLDDVDVVDEYQEIDSSVHSENVENHEVHNESIQNVQIDEHVQNDGDAQNEEYFQSEEPIQIERNILVSDLINPQPSIDTNNNVQIQENDSANQNAILPILTPEPATNAIIPPTDDSLMEHMLEIQQSLHTSSIVSVNFRETNLREKSQSVEPHADSQITSPAQTPDQPESIPEERNDVEHLNNSTNQSNAEEENRIESIPESVAIETITEQNNELIFEPIIINNEQVNDEEGGTDGGHESESESVPLQIESNDVSQPENSSQSIEESNTDTTADEIDEIDESVHGGPVRSPSIPTVIEPEASDIDLPKDDESQSQSQSVSISENQVSHSIDTESEMEELSVDVSASDSSTSKDNVSIRSSVSTVSVASEKLVESYQYQKITVPVITQCCSNTSINVMQLKNTTPAKSTVKNKIPVRRPSFTEPSASIRNIQNELFNKQLKQPPKIVPKKPSKIVPPKVFFKSSPEASTSTAAVNKMKQAQSKPSTSSGKQSIPKKKYYETCFSDDNYATSDDEKPITSVMKVIPNLVKIVESNTEEDVEVSYYLISYNFILFKLISYFFSILF